MTPRQHAITTMNAALNFEEDLTMLIEKRRRILEVCEKEIALATAEARREALEEAAKMIESAIELRGPIGCDEIVRMIRSLNGKA